MSNIHMQAILDFSDDSLYVDWYKEVIDALEDPNIRYIFLKGGAGAGKSYLIAQLVAQNIPDNKRIGIFRKVSATLRASCHQLLKDVVREREISDYVEVKESLIARAVHGKGQVNMFGLDDQEKIKSIAYLDWIWIEETTEISYDEFSQIDLRLRGGINQKIICTFNPILDTHRLKTEILDSGEYKNKSVWIEKTAWDNKFIDQQYLATLERFKITNPEKYRVYAQNLRGQGMKGQIFRNYKTFDYDIFPDVIGLDFGFNDPTALTYISKLDVGEKPDLFIQEKLYKKFLTSKDIIQEFKRIGVPKNILIVADNARPEMIKDISNAGYNIIACTKGKDSVVEGITHLQEYNIHIYGDNLYKEFGGYCWKLDKSGESLDIPDGGEDHLIDASRYATTEKRMKKGARGLVVDI